MGRVLQRIYSPEIPGKVDDLLNREVDLVLENKSVLHGVIFKVSSDSLVLRNMMRNKYVVLFSDINEIVFV